jgi:glycosyltransferase involved in cell wall biosynthesis
VQTQLEAIMRELAALGVEVEPERWWDERQTGDVLQYFGRPPSVQHVRLAQQKGRRVVMFENLDQTASRSRLALFGQRCLTRLGRAALAGLTVRLAWEVYRELDAMIYVTPIEWATAQYLFDADPARGHVIGHGLEVEALAALSEPEPPEDYLVSVATIAPRKNTVRLAQAARAAGVPVVFLGKPYATDDPYFREFEALVDGKFVRYPGFVSEAEKFRWLRGARGFVLCSQFESGCIAVYEAAAAGLPMLLSDRPWAAQVYGAVPGIEFVVPERAPLATRLKDFFSRAHRQTQPTFPVPSWRTVAAAYLRVYEQTLAHPVKLP